jgi:BASS family bile acid:Na+ symporter
MSMSLAELIPLAIKMSVILYLFTLGLEANSQDAAYFGRHPGLLVRSLLSMNIIMPLFAAAAMASFNLHPAIKIAVTALALSPVPPALPMQTKGGTLSYAISMLVAAALLAIIIIPAGIELVAKLSAKEIHMTPGAVALIVFPNRASGACLRGRCAQLSISFRDEIPALQGRLIVVFSLVRARGQFDLWPFNFLCWDLAENV